MVSCPIPQFNVCGIVLGLSYPLLVVILYLIVIFLLPHLPIYGYLRSSCERREPLKLIFVLYRKVHPPGPARSRPKHCDPIRRQRLR